MPVFSRTLGRNTPAQGNCFPNAIGVTLLWMQFLEWSAVYFCLHLHSHTETVMKHGCLQVQKQYPKRRCARDESLVGLRALKSLGRKLLTLGNVEALLYIGLSST